MYKMTFLIFSFYLYSPLSFSGVKKTTKTHSETNKPKKALQKKSMQTIMDSFIGLIPYITDINKFKTKENHQIIYSRMSNLANTFKKIHQNKNLKNSIIKTNSKLMSDHLDDTLENFKGEHKNFAYYRLKSSSQLCINCHGGLLIEHQFDKELSFANINSSNFKNSYDHANFLILTRQYDKAVLRCIETIDQEIEKKKSSRDSKQFTKILFNDDVIYKSLKKIVTIYTRPQYKPERAINILEKYSDNQSLSKMTIIEVRNWISQLESWISENSNFEEPRNLNEIKQFIAKYLKDQNSFKMIDLLIFNGVLSRFINLYPKTEVTPKIIFWLAKTERKIDNHLFFNISESLLKECIESYSTHPYAKKCFDELEQYITFGHTGTSGTYIPDEEKRELLRLKKLIKKSQKTEK